MGVLKKTLFSICRYAGFTRLFRWINRNKVLILAYHGVLDPCRGEDRGFLYDNFVDADLFERQMSYLAGNYRVLSLSEMVRRIEEKRSFPKNSVVLTFDDGFKNNLTVAYPIMKRTGLSFTVFLTTGLIGSDREMLWTEKVKWMIFHTGALSLSWNVGGRELSFPLATPREKEYAARRIMEDLKTSPVDSRRKKEKLLEKSLAGGRRVVPTDGERYDYLDWKDVRQMAKEGVEFGSHTVNHPILTSLSREAAAREIRDSRERIESNTAGKCRLFSFPNGTRKDFSEIHKTILKESGYSCAATIIPGLNDRYTDPYELRRFHVSRDTDFTRFVMVVTGSLHFLKKILFLN